MRALHRLRQLSATNLNGDRPLCNPSIEGDSLLEQEQFVG
jgi:hypothetical protein